MITGALQTTALLASCHYCSHSGVRRKSQTQIGQNKARTLPCTCPFCQTKVILPPHLLLLLSPHAPSPTYGLLMKRSSPNTLRSLSFRFLLSSYRLSLLPFIVFGWFISHLAGKGNKSHWGSVCTTLSSRSRPPTIFFFCLLFLLWWQTLSGDGQEILGVQFFVVK